MCVTGTAAGHEADNSPLSGEVKNEWSYTSTPLYAFTVCTGTTLLHFLWKGVKNSNKNVKYLLNLLAATQIWFTVNRVGCLDCGKSRVR